MSYATGELLLIHVQGLLQQLLLVIIRLVLMLLLTLLKLSPRHLLLSVLLPFL